LAFFDEGDEPRTRVAPRTSGARSAPRTGGGGGGGGGVADSQTVRNRRLVALGAGLVLFVLLAVLVNSCLDSRAENRLKDYNRDVATVIAQSDRDVARPFFDLLAQGGSSPVELESQVNQLRNVADRHVDQAEEFDVPDELSTAQRNLLLTLDMRASAIGKIAGQLRTALADGDQASNATTQIAAQMQQFLASDVIYDTRVIPFIQEALDAKEIGGQDLADSQFLPNLTWLQPDQVADRLGAQGGGGAAATDEEPAPGLHGHGLVSVAVGDTTLQPGETANRIPAGSDIAFTVTVANQGENEEQNVNVSVRIRGDGGRPLTARRRIDQTTPGANAEVTIPLTQAPPIGTPVTIDISVGKVPGEEKVDNNRQSYTAIFTR
jgi:hypothetical protein